MKWPEPFCITAGIAFSDPFAVGRSKMNWKILQQPKYLNLIGALILMLGLSSAALIYQRAAHAPYGASGYDVVDGVIYPIMPQDSKMYRHNLEVYGGKFNVMLDDFRRWFVGLWHGKSLAFMIACISIVISSGFFYAAHYLTPPFDPEIHAKNNPDGTG